MTCILIFTDLRRIQSTTFDDKIDFETTVTEQNNAGTFAWAMISTTIVRMPKYGFLIRLNYC